MKNIKAIVSFMFFVISMITMLALTEDSSIAIQNGLVLCVNSIIPNLFPFFVVSNIWIISGNADILSTMLAPLMERLFHISGASALPFLLGAIGGYPTGAGTVAQLYEKGQISKKDAEQALLFCNNAGPAFTIGVVGISLFQSTAIGMTLYVIHILAALLVGIILRPDNVEPPEKYATTDTSPKQFASNITKAIKIGGNTTLLVCMYVVFFSFLLHTLQAVLDEIIPASILLPTLGLLELTNGITIIGKSSLDLRLQFILASAFLGFGGLSVLFQSISLLTPCGLSGGNMLKGKLLQAAISTVVSTLVHPILFKHITCFGILKNTPTIQPPLISAAMVFIFTILAKISSGKQTNYRL